jgi:hypothetical protein
MAISRNFGSKSDALVWAREQDLRLTNVVRSLGFLSSLRNRLTDTESRKVHGARSPMLRSGTVTNVV